MNTASTSKSRTWNWLDDRLGIGGLRYPVPAHANKLAFTLGGITLGSLVLLIITGIYLAQFYDPTPAEAHASVDYIITEVFLGALVRSVHYWLSAAFVITLLLHMVRTFATASFKAPREFIWITGVILFLLGGGLLFSGTVLKFDQEAIEALEHNSAIAGMFGSFGFWLSTDFTGAVSLLMRMYIAHVSILPMMVVGVLAIHMLLIKRHKISPLPWGSAEEVRAHESDEQQKTFTSHMRHIGLWSLIVLGVALLLAGLAPAGLGPQGVEGIEVTKPPWYFVWLYPFENWIGIDALWAIPGLLILGLLAIPFLDRSPERDPRRRKFWIILGAIVLLIWLGMTIYGKLSPLVSHVGM